MASLVEPSVDIDQLSQSDPPTVEDPSTFRNGHDERDTDVFIAVMGVTGVGKSTLISKLMTRDVKPQIGTGLRSCTTKIDVFQFALSDSVNVYLIDTPGFDDTFKSDSEILSTLASHYGGMYSMQIPLHGILYLHRISDTRMQGSSMQNLRVFKRLCGADAMNKVILVTTMWETVPEKTGSDREEELRTTKEFWGSMIQKGSRIERHWDNTDSAISLVNLIIQASQSVNVLQKPLQIQKEMVDGEKELNDTEAAKEIMESLDKRTSKNTKKLEETHREAQEDPGDEEDQAQLQETIIYLKTKIQEDLQLQQRLQTDCATNLDKLLQDKDAQVNVEAAERKEGRLEEEYLSRDSTVSQNSRSDVHIDRRQSWSESYPQRADDSEPWYSRGTKVFSISLKGRHCSFLGPAHSKSYLPQSTRNNLVTLERTSDYRIKRVVLGEKSSYFVHYHQGSMFRKCYYWGAVQKLYPDLFHFLGTNRNTACPSSISLGPAGSYFINVDGRISFKCHPRSPIDADAQHANRLWWGVNGSYVLEFSDNVKTVTFDLKGQYERLGAILEGKKEGIKELALNIEDGNSFALILNDGSVYHSGVDDIVSSSFKEYADKHFGNL